MSWAKRKRKSSRIKDEGEHKHRNGISTGTVMSVTPSTLRRLKPGVSLGDLERGTGFTMSHLSRIFNGRRTPSLRAASRISAFLGVSLDDLNAILAEAEREKTPGDVIIRRPKAEEGVANEQPVAE